MSGAKHYDRAYFDRWYRGPDAPVGSPASLRRKAAAAVAVAEFVLDRPLLRVLDIGCGEARWQPVLYELRPRCSYLGIDSSEYAVERFGEPRNVRFGRFGELALHDFEQPFDLVVCADVLHYLERKEIMRGLPALADLVGGVAFLEVFTRGDDVEGDMVGFRHRPASSYRAMFSAVGLVPIGLQFYVTQAVAQELDVLELPC